MVSPHLKFIPWKVVLGHVHEYQKTHTGELTFLDVGGGGLGKSKHSAKGYQYSILEPNMSLLDQDTLQATTSVIDIIDADICHCPQVEDNSYDIVFSRNVFEHLKEPWNAAKECVRIVKVGGLLLHITSFAARYHPVPVDFFRYSHSGLAYLFERTKQVETIFAGYDISSRRKDKRGKPKRNGLDVPPVDELGGWRENWKTIYIGRRQARNDW